MDLSHIRNLTYYPGGHLYTGGIIDSVPAAEQLIREKIRIVFTFSGIDPDAKEYLLHHRVAVIELGPAPGAGRFEFFQERVLPALGHLKQDEAISFHCTMGREISREMAVLAMFEGRHMPLDAIRDSLSNLSSIGADGERLGMSTDFGWLYQRLMDYVNYRAHAISRRFQVQPQKPGPEPVLKLPARKPRRGGGGFMRPPRFPRRKPM